MSLKGHYNHFRGGPPERAASGGLLPLWTPLAVSLYQRLSLEAREVRHDVKLVYEQFYFHDTKVEIIEAEAVRVEAEVSTLSALSRPSGSG
jgi:hypothetical protein